MTLNIKAITNGKTVHKMSWKRCLSLKCIPKYAFSPITKLAILKIYISAQLLNLTQRGKHEVDHIIPINSPYVCGLHVPCNLQVLSKVKNTNKSNNFVPYREINGRKYYFNSEFLGRKGFKPSRKFNPTKKNPTKLVKKRSKALKINGKRVKTVRKRVK